MIIQAIKSRHSTYFATGLFRSQYITAVQQNPSKGAATSTALPSANKRHHVPIPSSPHEAKAFSFTFALSFPQRLKSDLLGERLASE